MSFYEDMYYNLPESERETFLNSLPKEENKKLLFIINRNNAMKNLDEEQKEFFKNVYNNMPDDSKNSFLVMFNSILQKNRIQYLKIFENINDCKINYSYSMSKNDIKYILPEREDDINFIIDNIKGYESEFYRILYIFISSEIMKILNSFGYINISRESNDFLGKYDYNFDNYYKTKELNSKFLEVLFNIPEDKKEFFFNQFENTDELRDVSFIEILRYMLNKDKELFLEIFRNNVDNQNIDLNNKSGMSFAWLNTESGIGFIFPNNTSVANVLWLNGSGSGSGENNLFFKEAKDIESFFVNKSGVNSEIRKFISNGNNGLRMVVLFGGQLISIISALYNQLENIEKFVFSRVVDIIIKYELSEVLDLFKRDLNIDFLNLSKLVNIDKMFDYISIFYNNDKINYTIDYDIDNEIIIEYSNKCKAKLDEILSLVENFEYAIKEDYKKSCKEIYNILDRGINDKSKFNKLIDYVNNLYKTAFYKNNNKSSLSYIIDIDEEGIEYIEHIN